MLASIHLEHRPANVYALFPQYGPLADCALPRPGAINGQIGTLTDCHTALYARACIDNPRAYG